MRALGFVPQPQPTSSYIYEPSYLLGIDVVKTVQLWWNHPVRFWAAKSIQFLLLLPLIVLILKLRTPLLASLRAELLWLLPLALGVLLVLNLSKWHRNTRQHRRHLACWGLLALCGAGLALMVTAEVRYHQAQRAVLTGDPAQLARLGQHLVVGYRDFDSVKTLVEKQAIGGIFISHRNLQGPSLQPLRDQIAALQAIRQAQALPPLWVATDQEGGIVSRLSPPLTLLPPLSDIVDQSATLAERQQRVTAYGDTHGRELAALGINLNFAPVVDLNKGIVNPDDKYSVIYRRAISADQAVVTAAAKDYCSALFSHGVYCTLKHFPGLGRLNADTHLTSAHLDTPVAELAQDDWRPFQQIMGTAGAMTMLGHPLLTAVDDQHPVSFSAAVVQDILRQQWGYDGVLITDDFCMGAVFDSRDGATGAAVKALNAGVDLILVSYDADLYYPVMAALIKAEQGDRLSPDRLAESRVRLKLALSLKAST